MLNNPVPLNFRQESLKKTFTFIDNKSRPSPTSITSSGPGSHSFPYSPVLGSHLDSFIKTGSLGGGVSDFQISGQFQSAAKGDNKLDDTKDAL